METTDSATAEQSSSPSNTGGRLTLHFPSLRFLQSPVSSLLEHSGILSFRSGNAYAEANSNTSVPVIVNAGAVNVQNPSNSESIASFNGADVTGDGDAVHREFSIRIIGEQDRIGVNDGGGMGLVVGGDAVDGNVESGGGGNNDREESPLQRYDIQQVARWIEQILPFSLLLLVVFIRQHLQGFAVAIYITAVLFRSNAIVRKQTALKGERKISILVGYSVFFTLHILVVYWWTLSDELFRLLLMIPPRAIPPFWHAAFIILVNDTMVRQAGMVLKLILLMYYKNGRGHNFRRQGQMLTLVEYTLLLYRSMLPTLVWYRFFLNKEYGSLFSSLTTGLYLTFKLTSIVEKVQSFFASLRALSRKDVHYGSYATLEQVSAAGDLCAICQEKMHSPILLCCKHIFCEDCVSEWFERERTCPLCRALVRPADLQSYGDGSTCLLFQLF